MKEKSKQKNNPRQLPITTCNEALTGAMFEGEHRYWPESSGETLGRASVSLRESFPMRARMVVRPRSSVTAPTIQLLSPFPTKKEKFHYFPLFLLSFFLFKKKNIYETRLKVKTTEPKGSSYNRAAIIIVSAYIWYSKNHFLAQF
jgi:hypothetical protein